MCVWERESRRVSVREKGVEKDGGECVCVCEREREREEEDGGECLCV